MTTLPHGFAQRYAVALESHLADAGEAALHEAYELGRQALDDALGVLAIAALHHDALGALVADDPVDDEEHRMAMAAEFLAECLSPFEMTLLGYREANLRLATLNERLQRANAETKAANEQLLSEMNERQRAEEALRQAQKLQAIGRLAGGVAHHFNNLLTVVLGSLDLARAPDTRAEALPQLLTTALRAAARGAKVTKQLLSFSRQQTLSPQVIEPSARLHDLAILLGGSLRGDITIETDLPVDLWPIEIDVSELELALLNLCINARDAMPNGGVVRLSAANRSVRNEQLGLAGDYVVIELADNGTGIPPEILPRVFDPFFTTKDVGAGTGLGLSQVHGFSHQSGGALAIDSVVGQGTTVKLYLPASPSAAAKSSAAEPAVHEHRALAVVLVVEDDVDVADTTTGALERCGFTVKRAYRSGAALELLTQGETVDLVFSDIVMPDGMNGIELAEEVGRRFPRIPVLLATGYSDALADATAKGLQIISKPYRPKELCACIAELLGKHPP